jgi:hypothetical protein
MTTIQHLTSFYSELQKRNAAEPKLHHCAALLARVRVLCGEIGSANERLSEMSAAAFKLSKDIVQMPGMPYLARVDPDLFKKELEKRTRAALASKGYPDNDALRVALSGFYRELDACSTELRSLVVQPIRI